MTAARRKGSIVCRARSGIRGAFARRSAAVGLGLSVACGPAWAILPPLPSASDDTAVQIEGTVLAITHTDRDRGPDPREPTHVLTPSGQRIALAPSGRRRVERTFDLTVKLEKTITARDPAAPRPPSGRFAVIHGAQLFGPWPRSGVGGIDRLVVGTRARFSLERRDDGAWFIVEPDGLVLLDGR